MFVALSVVAEPVVTVAYVVADSLTTSAAQAVAAVLSRFVLVSLKLQYIKKHRSMPVSSRCYELDK